ncbi:HAD family hydrolase [Kitasatospora sp. NPDC001664]
MTAAPTTPVATIATDVGGVLYYDEPFELAWLQGVLERAAQADPRLTIETFTDRMRCFYLRRASATASPGLFTPAGAESWRAVRHNWAALAQIIPGALDALDELAADRPVCVVANQPPECQAVLDETGATKHLALVALDTLVGHAKPDPALLQWAIDQLGWQTHTTLMVGDRPDHDAAPAQRIGAQAALVNPPTGWTTPPGIDPAVVTAYEAVRAERQQVRHHPAAHRSRRVPDLAALRPALGSPPRAPGRGSIRAEEPRG